MDRKAILEALYNVPPKVVIKMPEYAPDKYKNTLLVKDDFAEIGFLFLILLVIYSINSKCFFCNFFSNIIWASLLIIFTIVIPLIVSRIYTHSIPKIFELQIDANRITINQNQFYSWGNIENEKTKPLGILELLDYSMTTSPSCPVEDNAYKICFTDKNTNEKIEFLVKANFNKKNYYSQEEIANEKPKESILGKLLYSIPIAFFNVRTERLPILECRSSVANLLVSYRKIFESLENENKNL